MKRTVIKECDNKSLTLIEEVNKKDYYEVKIENKIKLYRNYKNALKHFEKFTK